VSSSLASFNAAGLPRENALVQALPLSSWRLNYGPFDTIPTRFRQGRTPIRAARTRSYRSANRRPNRHLGRQHAIEPADVEESSPACHSHPALRSVLSRGNDLPANVAFTVFREQPISRAISEIDTPSDLRSRRISAQSSMISTCFLPGSTPARVTGKLVNFQLPHRGQYSAAADTEFRRYGHYAWAVNGVATPVPYLCRSAASHGVSIVSSKLFPSMLT
jgi:hypothetical protein